MITGLLIGIFIGFVFSIPPLGPTYFAIVEKGLRKEVNNAVAIGVGAGFIDMVYILLSYGGVSLIVSLLPDVVKEFFLENEELLKLILAFLGCIFIILYGIKIMKAKAKIDIKQEEKKELQEDFEKRFEQVDTVFKKTEKSIDKILHTDLIEKSKSEIFRNFMIGVVMCLSSPTMPASWFAVVSYLKSYGIVNTNFFTGFFLALGVLVGTSVWFYIMTRLIFRHSEKLNVSVISKLNFFTGMFLLILGIVLLYKVSASYYFTVYH